MSNTTIVQSHYRSLNILFFIIFIKLISVWFKLIIHVRVWLQFDVKNGVEALPVARPFYYFELASTWIILLPPLTWKDLSFKTVAVNFDIPTFEYGLEIWFTNIFFKYSAFSALKWKLKTTIRIQVSFLPEQIQKLKQTLSKHYQGIKLIVCLHTKKLIRMKSYINFFGYINHWFGSISKLFTHAFP